MRPRTDGESVSSRTSFNLRRPSARTLRRWRAVQPFGLLNRRTRSLAPAAAFVDFVVVAFALAIAEHLFDGLATLGRDALGRGHCLQANNRRADEVDRIARTDGLGQNVLDADHFEHGAHRAAGDDAGAFRSRLHEDARRTVV